MSAPTWSGSFTSGGTTYPFTMVGTDPAAGQVTHVSVEIIPLSLDFAGSGCVLEDSGMAADLEASPLFTPTGLPTGVTQWLDNYQRARQGQQRRMCQVLSWALARSPGARSLAWARLAAFCEAGLFRPR
jgi:hypothetical protein